MQYHSLYTTNLSLIAGNILGGQLGVRVWFFLPEVSRVLKPALHARPDVQLYRQAETVLSLSGLLGQRKESFVDFDLCSVF